MIADILVLRRFLRPPRLFLSLTLSHPTLPAVVRCPCRYQEAVACQEEEGVEGLAMALGLGKAIEDTFLAEDCPIEVST